MQPEAKIPLGYIDLETRAKAIYAMNDILLNHMFDNPENWETLRSIVNIFTIAYMLTAPSTTLTTVDGEIYVETQYKYLLNSNNATRAQDIKIANTEEVTFLEFQNKARTNPPVPERAVEYFGLGIGHNRGKIANQIWLLAENLDSVLGGQAFARYVLTNENTHEAHPTSSGILYISLSKLAQEKSTAGELAAFLLGRNFTPEDAQVQKIAKAFINGMDTFKTDKEVTAGMLSLLERGREEGLAEGEARGEARGEAKGTLSALDELLKLVSQGHTPEEASKIIRSKYTNAS